jgi:hypothetical protein
MLLPSENQVFMMKNIIFALFIFAAGASFAVSAKEDAHSMKYSPEAFHAKLLEYQSLVEESLVWRMQAVNFIRELEQTPVYSSEQLDTIHHAGTERYRNIRERLMAAAKEYEWITDPGVAVALTNKSSAIRKTDRWWNPFDDDARLIEVNPDGDVGQYHIKTAKLSLASALILYDNYLVAIGQFQEYDKARRIINSDNTALSDYLEKVSNSFTDTENYKRTAKAVRLFKQVLAWEDQNRNSRLVQDMDNQYLNQLIEGSLAYQKIDEISFFDIQEAKIKIFANEIEDAVNGLVSEASNEVSKVFGNGVGLIASRRGKLDGLSAPEKQALAAQLEPLDIMLEKTPFRLTDKFIPGHWGHVALWAGTEEELKRLGVWKKLPALYQEAVSRNGYQGPSFQNSIRSGHYIIEALRPGVSINTLNHFLNIDDLAVLRHSHLSDAQRREYLIYAFEQLGKSYDFNFDVETDSKIVCSELAYVVYRDPELKWPTDKTLGRYTISPDHVASKATSHNPFYPVLLYHNGRLVEGDIQQQFNHLLDEAGASLALNAHR